MFRALFKSILGRGSREGTEGGASASSPKAEQVIVAQKLSGGTSARHVNPPKSMPSIALDAQLWDQVGTASAELLATWGDEASCGDAEELLQLIVHSDRSVIEQPPAAAQAVLSLLGRRNYGQGDITRLIERDPALSQALLRHSNSIFYATKHGEPVISIKSAVQRIGGTGVHATVMSQVVRGQLSRPGGVFDRMVSMAWEHMVGVAPIARSLSRTFGVDGESAYTLGLLHDIGKLVFFSEVAALRKRKRRDVRLSPHFVASALQSLHEPLGGIAALQWGLDPSSSWVIAHHHRRDLPETPDRLTEVIFVAERAELACRTRRLMDLTEVWRLGKLTASAEDARVPLEACGALGATIDTQPPQELRPAV